MLLKQLSNIKKFCFPRRWGCATRRVSPGEGGGGWFKRDAGVSRGVVATSKETMQVMWCHNGFPARNHTGEGLFVSF